MNKNGIQDLMDKQRFRPQHIQKALLQSGVPGNWSSIQNIYNLTKGITTPKDPYVYIVLANTLNVEIEIIIMRYTQARKTTSQSASLKDVDTALNDSTLDW